MYTIAEYTKNFKTFCSGNDCIWNSENCELLQTVCEMFVEYFQQFNAKTLHTHRDLYSLETVYNNMILMFRWMLMLFLCLTWWASQIISIAVERKTGIIEGIFRWKHHHRTTNKTEWQLFLYPPEQKSFLSTTSIITGGQFERVYTKINGAIVKAAFLLLFSVISTPFWCLVSFICAKNNGVRCILSFSIWKVSTGMDGKRSKLARFFCECLLIVKKLVLICHFQVFAYSFHSLFCCFFSSSLLFVE